MSGNARELEEERVAGRWPGNEDLGPTAARSWVLPTA